MADSAYRTRYFSGRETPAISGQFGGESLVAMARNHAAAAWEYDRENREDGFTDLRIAAGDQWPAQIRLERENTGRPCITINKMMQFVYQCANDIRTNPPGIKIVPGTGDDDVVEMAEIYSGMVRSIENASNANNIYATAGGHAILCGQGNWRVNTRYVDDDVFDQEIVMQGIRHPFSVLWDPMAIEPDRSDAEWCQVTQLIHKDVYRERYPGASMSSFDVPIPGQDPEAGLFWRNGDWIRLCEYWRKVAYKRKLAQFGNGEVLDITKIKHNQMQQIVQEIGDPVQTRDVEAKKVKQSLVSAVDILEPEAAWLGKHIPIITTIGGEIPLDTKVVRFGLVRFARDAQQLYNYARSAAAESIGLAPRSPYLVTTKMIARYVDVWNTHNSTARPYLPFDPDKDAPNGPTRLHPPETPEAFFREQQIASEDMKSSTGIYDASLGARSNETSGVAINARDRQGDTATAHYQSNLVSSMIHCGRVLIDLIPKIYDTQRIVRTIGDDEAEDFVPINHVVLSDNGEPVLLNDLTQGRYDVRPRTGPSYATKRLESADSMLQFSKAVPGAAALIGDLIAKSMDWPGADEIAKRLKRAVPPQILGPDDQADDDKGKDGQPTPEQQQKQQAQETAAKVAAAQAQQAMEKVDADIAKAKASAEKDNMTALNSKVDALIKIMGQLAMAGGDPMAAVSTPIWPDAAGPGGGNPAGAPMPPAPSQQPPSPPSGPPQGGPAPGGSPPQMDVPSGDLSGFLGGSPPPGHAQPGANAFAAGMGPEGNSPRAPRGGAF